jgi:hypothetical protein
MNRKLRLVPGVAAIVVSIASAHAQQIRVVVDGERVHFGGQPPIEINDRVLVPLRGVFEDLGAQVNWNPSNQTVTARRGDTRVRLAIGERTASVNGEPVSLDVPAQIIDGSTMVPLRFIGEALGEKVHWSPENQTVEVFRAEEYSFDRPKEDRRNWRIDERPDTVMQTPPPPPQPRVEIENPPPPPPPLILDVDTILPTELNISRRHWRAGDPVHAVIPVYPGLPPNCEVSGVVRQVIPAYYGQPPTITLHFDTLITPKGITYQIDGSGVPLTSRMQVRSAYGVVGEQYIRIHPSGRIGIRLIRPLRLQRDRNVFVPRIERPREPFPQ